MPRASACCKSHHQGFEVLTSVHAQLCREPDQQGILPIFNDWCDALCLNDGWVIVRITGIPPLPSAGARVDQKPHLHLVGATPQAAIDAPDRGRSRECERGQGSTARIDQFDPNSAFS